MDEGIQAEVAAVVGWVEKANLTPETRDNLLWCLKQLPKLLRDFGRTCDIRYGEEILRLERAMLGRLAGEKAPELEEALVGLLRGLHERLGLPGPAPTTTPKPPPPKTKRRKTG